MWSFLFITDNALLKLNVSSLSGKWPTAVAEALPIKSLSTIYMKCGSALSARPSCHLLRQSGDPMGTEGLSLFVAFIILADSGSWFTIIGL